MQHLLQNKILSRRKKKKKKEKKKKKKRKKHRIKNKSASLLKIS